MPKYVTQKEAIDLYFSMPGNVDLSTDDEEHEKTSQEARQTRSTSRNSGPEICVAEIVYVYGDSTEIDEGSGDEMSDSWRGYLPPQDSQKFSTAASLLCDPGVGGHPTLSI